jgi:hypothetical protein
MQNEIFGINLNDEGRSHLIQLYKKVKIIFIGSIIWSAINVLSIIIRLTALKQLFSYGKNTSQLVIVYAIWVLTIILIPLQGYYYFAFSKEMKLSIEEQSVEKFNGGFRLLNVNATLVLLSLLMNFFSILYNVLSPYLH